MQVIPLTAIGNAAIQLTATATKLQRGILVFAAPSNTIPVFVGKGNAITAGTSALSGVPVYPGGSVFIPRESLLTKGDGLASNLWAIAASGSNTIYAVLDGDPASASGSASGGPATVADGADASEGVTTDAIVAAGATGTVQAKLRRLAADGDTTGTRVNSTAYEASHILKAAAGKLVLLVGYNSGAAQFIQLYDSATLPADAVAPALVFAVPATSNFSLDIPTTGMPFGNGIVVGNSSTGPTKTIGAANCYFTAVVMGPSQ